MSEWIARHRDVFNLVLIGMTGLLAIVTILQWNEAANLSETTKQLLDTTKQTTVLLGQMTDKTTQLVDAMNTSIMDAEYQTSLQTYNAGKPFTPLIGNCKFDSNSSKLTHNIFITDAIDNPTTIDFRMVATYWFYTQYQNGSGLQSDNPTWFYKIPQIIGPGKAFPYTLDLTYPLNSTKNLDRPYLYVMYQLTYNPYFAPKDVDISGPINSTFHLLIGFEKDKNSNDWKEITSNIHAAC